MLQKEISHFIPVSDWPTLEELAEAFSENLMPDTGKLAGTSVTLIFDNNLKILHEFGDAKKMTWRILEGDQTGLSGGAEYAAFEVRPGTFLVDFYKPEYDEEVSLVLKTATGQATVATSGFHQVHGEKRTWTELCTAFVEGAGSTEPFEVTEELIGKHIMYRYTPRDVYEHVYLNKGTMTWHCLRGTEKGLADTERCQILKLDEKLYLLFWTETIMPVESVVVVDLEQMRSTGRFFCWDPKPQRDVRVRFGSYATILSEAYPEKVLAQYES